jgi:NAD(P)-dependent dehydrogenase (short-subunit alcohol dehydrogenase family)
MGAASTKENKHFDAACDALPSLAGKVVAITGCTSGTGLVTAQVAASKGAEHIFLLNRPSERAIQAETSIRQQIATTTNTKTVVETIACDLQDFDSVRSAAASIRSKCTKLDVLCNNAGIMSFDDIATKDGYDVQMQTNHLSHFLLTKELFPLLKASGDARIVQHSSVVRHGSPLNAKYFGPNGGNLGGNSNSILFKGANWERYHQSKLANACFSAALATKLRDAKLDASIRAVCAAPGLAQTNLQQTTQASGGGMGGFMWIMHFSQSCQDGTIPLLQACFATNVANGDFLEPKDGYRGLPVAVPIDRNAANAEQQRMLWETSEKACGPFSI